MRAYSSCGSALLLALWSIVLLSISVFGVVEIVQVSVSHSAFHSTQMQARALALSGLAIAMNPQIEKDNSLLHHEIDGQKWTVSILGEGGRLNLNYVLNGKHSEILQRLFVLWGAKSSDAKQAVDNLTAWINSDLKSLTAARAEYQRAGLEHLPTGKLFTSLAEVQWVIGMDAISKAKPDWASSFTLWSDGPLDLNEATPDLLAAILNLPPSQCNAFATRRDGKDGINGTEDDVPVPDVKTLKDTFGLSDQQMKDLADQIGFADSVRRIESKGQIQPITVTISAVTRLKSTPPEYLSWTEL